MALHLNLLHEEILEQRQRQRDPLKIGMLVLSACGAILFIYYAWNAYRTLEIKTRLSHITVEWKKIEPEVTKAQKRSTELTNIINTTRVLDEYIDNRFFWGPFLDRLARCVPPNAQLTNLEGVVLDEDRKSTRLNSSHANISYAVFCLKKKNTKPRQTLDLGCGTRRFTALLAETFGGSVIGIDASVTMLHERTPAAGAPCTFASSHAPP